MDRILGRKSTRIQRTCTTNWTQLTYMEHSTHHQQNTHFSPVHMEQSLELGPWDIAYTLWDSNALKNRSYLESISVTPSFSSTQKQVSPLKNFKQKVVWSNFHFYNITLAVNYISEYDNLEEGRRDRSYFHSPLQRGCYLGQAGGRGDWGKVEEFKIFHIGDWF